MCAIASSRGAEIRAIMRVIEAVREHYPRMEISQLAVLLRILDKPGIKAAELMKATGLSKSALSRAVRILGSEPYVRDSDGSEQTGLNLITQVTDMEDSRAKLLAPTIWGMKLREDIERIVGEVNGKT